MCSVLGAGAVRTAGSPQHEHATRALSTEDGARSTPRYALLKRAAAASTFSASLFLYATSFFATSVSATPRICAASTPAFVAPGLPIETVATGTPGGICTVDSSASQ